jgi:epoxyqueuosine reductase QueG
MTTEKILSDLLGAKVGVCGFDEIKQHLLPCRNLSYIPQNAKSVLLFVFPYKVKEEKPKNICRYAAVPDYHEVCKETLDGFCKRLSEKYGGYSFVPFLDNSPIPEVLAGATAGLGVRGKNGLLITKEYGSYIFIGEIVTDMEVVFENRYAECENCGLCEKACPVGLNKSRCL